MEVGGYRPVETIPTPARAAEVASAAAELRGDAKNIEGAAKAQIRNEQLKDSAENRLKGLEVSPGVGIAARAALEVIASATSFGATVEGLKSGLDAKLAGGAEMVARFIGDVKLGEWGRKVNIATQLAEAKELDMNKMEATLESGLPDVRGLVPEKARGFMDKLASHFRKGQGEHERRADEMKTRAESLRAMKTEKAPMSAGLEKTVSSLQATQSEQAAKIAALEAYIQNLKGEAGTAARVVGGTTLENKVANGPFN